MEARIKDIYEALLWAAPEFPDEVSQMALELCGRRMNQPMPFNGGLMSRSDTPSFARNGAKRTLKETTLSRFLFRK